MKNSLICHNGVIPKLYTLPKIHKQPLSMRPIVAGINSPTYRLAKFYHQILSHITGKKSSHVSNALQFKKCIDSISIPPGYILCSLDVKSLYTNIPIELFDNIIKEHWSDISKYTPISLDQFLIGLRAILNNNAFSFNKKFTFKPLD